MRLFKSIFTKNEVKAEAAPPINSAEFKKLIAKYFTPRLRSEGWNGSGFHFRKTSEDNCIFVLSFQPDKYGGECWVEIGMHLDFLKNIDGQKYDLKKITCPSIDIRRRISPDSSVNYTWKYRSSEQDNKLVINSIWETFNSDGKDFINQFKGFPHPFLDIKVDDIDKRDDKYQINGIPFPPDVRTAWYLSQVYLYTENNDKAKKFAEFGLSRINGQNGSALKKDLENIIEVANIS